MFYLPPMRSRYVRWYLGLAESDWPWPGQAHSSGTATRAACDQAPVGRQGGRRRAQDRASDVGRSQGVPQPYLYLRMARSYIAQRVMGPAGYCQPHVGCGTGWGSRSHCGLLVELKNNAHQLLGILQQLRLLVVFILLIIAPTFVLLVFEGREIRPIAGYCRQDSIRPVPQLAL